MSSNIGKLDFLKERLEICRYRMKILYFELLSNQFNSRIHFILNQNGIFHLNNCIWSRDDIESGPDTCHCYQALAYPHDFFADGMKKLSETYRILNLPCFEIEVSNSRFLYLPKKDKDENIKEFYEYGVSFRKNVLLWYEIYKEKVNVLQFQIKVRELGKEDEIDACYNSISEEWHLTDCIRSVAWDKGPDTCFCQKAIVDPWKYLKEKYNYVNTKKYLEKIKNKKIPINYKVYRDIIPEIF